MISINSNPAVLITQRNINYSNKLINQALERMSTGYKINSASDNPAVYYTASNINLTLRGLNTAQTNISTAQSYLNITEGALKQMHDVSLRLRDLALQGSSSTLSHESRKAVQKEANALLEELSRLKTSTSFKNLNVFGYNQNDAQIFSLLSAPPPRNSGIQLQSRFTGITDIPCRI